MPRLSTPNKVLSLITGQAVPGNAGVALMARLVGNDDSLVTQASLSTITYDVYDIQAYKDSGDAATQLLSSTALTVSAVIFDDLVQTDDLWTKDGPGNLGTDGRWGYSFKHVIPASTFTIASSGHRCRAQVLFTPTSGQQFRADYEFDTLKVFSATNLS